MIARQPSDSGTGASRKLRQSARRTRRTVRFSDPEWKQVQQAASRRGITASDYVRNVVMSAAAGVPQSENAALSPALVEIIKLTHRSAYILSTLKRDEMIRDGRAREMDEVVRAARHAQQDVFDSRFLHHHPAED